MGIVDKYSARSGRVLLCWVALLLAATTQAADDEPGAWLILSTGNYIESQGDASRFRYAFDAQYRWVDRAGGVTQYLLRPALGYDLRPGLSVWLGYAYLHADRQGGGSADEQRLWQQLAWEFDGAGESRWLLRGRLEERRFRQADDTGLTLRLMLRGRFPVRGRPNLKFVAAMGMADSVYCLNDATWLRCFV